MSDIPMNYILDGAVALAIIIGFFIGRKRGLVYSVLSLISYAASFMVAKMGSTVVANWFYDTFVKSTLVRETGAKITEVIGGNDALAALQASGAGIDISSIINQVINSLPKFLTNGIDLSAISTNNFELTSIESLSSSIVSTIFYPVIIVIFINIAFVILFLLCLIVFKVIFKLTKILKKLPLIGKIDKIGGALLGVATSGMIIILITKVLAMFMTLSGTNSFLGISQAMVNATWLFRIFFNI